MKLKDIKTNFNKFNAYLRKELKNDSAYYDSMTYHIVKDKITFMVKHPDDFPKEYMESEIYDFDIEIELDSDTGVTQYGNRYRAQKKTMTLWIR